MKRTIFALAILVLALGVTGATYEEPQNAIANINPSSSTITRQEARWIYTLKTRFWHDGSRITVYHLPMDHTDHKEFVRTVLEMQPSAYTKTINANVNSGVTNVVKEVKNHQQMLDAVQGKYGAVGYLSKDFLLVNGIGHVDVLKIID